MLTTATSKRSAGLDHLRALAIIIVFVYHYRLFGNPPLVDKLGSFGWTGVDLFFVLSGYLIGGQLLSGIAREKPISYGEFYFKRFLRIIPAYGAFAKAIKKGIWLLAVLFVFGFIIRIYNWNHFLGGLALHYSVERPFLRLRDRILAKRKAALAVSVS